MKPTAILAVITFLAILVIAEVVALANTTNFPPQIPFSIPNPPHPLFDMGRPVPDHGSSLPKSLVPGIYETRPYAMMLKVPGPTADNCILRNSSPSPMPIKHPALETPQMVMGLPAK